jgi:teichuronic acid biosynthesis glycosyltransferase TuaC
MKVLSVTNMYPTDARPYYGIFVKEFVEALENLGVEVVTSFTDTTRGRHAYFAALPGLCRVLAREKYDVIHAHHTYSLCQVKAAQLLTRTRAPVVFTIHEGESMIPAGVRDRKADWLKRLVYLKRPKRWALKLADCVASVNEPIPRFLGYGGSYDVVTPGVNLELFRPLDKLECRRALGIQGGDRVLFFPADPGNPFKGFALVQGALRRLPFPVTVVTGGDIAHQDMPRYMNAADVVVQVSEFEASPMVVKEAMAVNAPMVAADSGDTREIFGSTAGYYICDKTADSVATAIGTALASAGRTGGRDRIVSLGLSQEEVAKRYLAIYEEAIGGPAHA